MPKVLGPFWRSTMLCTWAVDMGCMGKADDPALLRPLLPWPWPVLPWLAGM
jgi:hypothetical protein